MLVGLIGWVGVGAACATAVLAAAAALRYALVLSRWSERQVLESDFCEERRFILAHPEIGRKTRISHVVLMDAALWGVCCCEILGRSHPYDLLQRLCVLGTTATLALAVSLYWLVQARAADEEPGAVEQLTLGLYTVGAILPPVWLLETAFAWLRQPVIDVIELGLTGPTERTNWRRLACMPRRVVPYWVAERWLGGQEIEPHVEGAALTRVEEPYFEHDRDPAAVPRLLGAQAALMQRHEPWLWHMGAAWLCWAQLEDDERRDAGHGGCLAVMEHMASHGRLTAADLDRGPNGVTAQGGERAAALGSVAGKSAQAAADVRLWHAVALGGEILAQLDGWHAQRSELKDLAREARREAKQTFWAGEERRVSGTDPLKFAAGASAKLTVAILGLPAPSTRATSQGWAGRFLDATLRVAVDCGGNCAAWRGLDDTRFIVALHRAARAMWAMVLERLQQHVLSPLPPPPEPPQRPFQERHLRPGEDAAALPVTLFLPLREGVGFGFHIDEDGIIDSLSKTENGAVIATGMELGMRLLAVDTVPATSASHVAKLLGQHATGRAARFDLRPAPPPPELVFQRSKEAREAKLAAIEDAKREARKPYGKPFSVWEAEQAVEAAKAAEKEAKTLTVQSSVAEAGRAETDLLAQRTALELGSAEEGLVDLYCVSDGARSANVRQEVAVGGAERTARQLLRGLELEVWRKVCDRGAGVVAAPPPPPPGAGGEGPEDVVAVWIMQPDGEWAARSAGGKRAPDGEAQAIADRDEMKMLTGFEARAEGGGEEAEGKGEEEGAAVSSTRDAAVARRPSAFWVPALCALLLSTLSALFILFIDSQIEDDADLHDGSGTSGSGDSGSGDSGSGSALGEEEGTQRLLMLWLRLAGASLGVKLAVVDVLAAVMTATLCWDAGVVKLSVARAGGKHVHEGSEEDDERIWDSD